MTAPMPMPLPTEMLQRVMWYLDNASWRQARLASRCFYDAQNYKDILHSQMRVKVGARRKWWPVCRSGSLMTLDARLLKYGAASAQTHIGTKSIKAAIRAGRLDVLKWLHANIKQPCISYQVFDYYFLTYAAQMHCTAAAAEVLDWLLSLLSIKAPPLAMPRGHIVDYNGNNIDFFLHPAIRYASFYGRLQTLRTLLTFRSKYETDPGDDAILFWNICECATSNDQAHILDLMNRHCARRRGRNGHVRNAALLPVNVSRSERAIDHNMRYRVMLVALVYGSINVLDYLFEDCRTYVYKYIDINADDEQDMLVASREWLQAHSRAAIHAAAKRRRLAI